MRNSRFPDLSSEELVLAAILGSIEAFDELVRRFRGAVTLVAEQETGRRDAAEDVAQEAFLLAFKALPQLQDPSRFGGWLCAITRHRARRVAARDRRAEPAEPALLDRLILGESREAESPADVYARNEERGSLFAAVADLPPEYRAVLQLYYYEGWPVARIADFLSLPITTVKWRLHHGRRLLRRRLAEQPEDSHGGNEPEQHRDPAAPPPAARDRGPRPACKSDGPAPRRRAQRGAPVQSGRAAP